VFIFDVILRNRPGSSDPPVFTVFASSNDFIRAFDTDTGQSITIGPDSIEPATCVPEPSTLTLSGIGTLGLLLACAWRRRWVAV
jgi:hypothetical protein